MNESKKNFILDTNVILNDPDCFFKFSNNNIYIPTPVLQELDNFKDGKNVALRKAARKAINKIDQSIDHSNKNLTDGINIETGGKLFSMTVPTSKTSEKIDKDFKKSGIDNDILKCLKELSSSNSKTILVTQDTNLRVKANAIDLNAEKYKNARIENLEFLSGEIDTAQVGKNDIDKLYQNKVVRREKLRHNFSDVKDNSFIVLRASSSQSVICRKKARTIKKVPDNIKNFGKIQPKNTEQKLAFDVLDDDNIKLATIVGKAGTGKTLLSICIGLKKVIREEKYDELTIYRPTVPMGRGIGYIPGSIEDKIEPWMGPIYDNLDFLHKRATLGNWKDIEGVDDVYDSDIINIEALSYIRGRSLSNRFILIDEAQNLSSHEVKTIITRAGENTKIVMTGDPYQIDNRYLDKHSNGLTYLIDKMRGDHMFANAVLTQSERSELAERAASRL